MPTQTLYIFSVAVNSLGRNINLGLSSSLICLNETNLLEIDETRKLMLKPIGPLHTQVETLGGFSFFATMSKKQGVITPSSYDMGLRIAIMNELISSEQL